MTHSGPRSLGTVLVTGEDTNSVTDCRVRTLSKRIDAGCPGISDALACDVCQQKTVALVHGHSHQGLGCARLASVPVLNPGSLRYTRSWALLELQQSNINSAKPWQLTSFSFKILCERRP